MRRLTLAAVASITLAAAAAPALACMWDSDTLAEESLGKKDVLEIVTGKLRHHATAWYEAKIAYTQPMIDGGKAPKERYDDLAVALAKTGKLDDAIALLADKEARFPGEYTTEANLGTFLAMKGDNAGALDHLNRAIAINPDAHFGCEKYQVALLAWMDKLAADPTLAEKETFTGVPISEEMLEIIHPTDGGGIDTPKRKELDAQIVAITGLIRFGGNDQNMHLWFTLGVALGWEGHKSLAMRALRRAELLGHPRAAEVERWLAELNVPLRKAASRGRGADQGDQTESAVELGQQLADDDWAAGEKWEQAREDAEVALAQKHPKRAFGY
jgi:tetratricopeptide (TPR) repeat protein